VNKHLGPWKNVLGTNTLAYYEHEYITDVKRERKMGNKRIYFINIFPKVESKLSGSSEVISYLFFPSLSSSIKFVIAP
jgi:hypothetical protein